MSPLLGSNFAELTSNGYTLLSGNSIFYTDTTLVCVTSDTREPIWIYKKTQQRDSTSTTGKIWDSSTGISTLDIVTSRQGYYTCTVTGESIYTVAIFNPVITTSELIHLLLC